MDKHPLVLIGVTLTGADESVEPQDLVNLSIEFPFAEWGLLVGSHTRPGYPAGPWFAALAGAVTAAHPHSVRLALHVCGRPVRSILTAGALLTDYAIDFGKFRRMQLNLHGEEVPTTPAVIDRIVAVQQATRIPEIIVQLDGVNNWMLPSLLARGVQASGLYDGSHGTGVSPAQWPTPNPAWEVGYAGGLGPDEIGRQLDALRLTACGQRLWIDMETKLRSDGGAKFDLQKCRCVLEYCVQFFPKAAT